MLLELAPLEVPCPAVLTSWTAKAKSHALRTLSQSAGRIIFVAVEKLTNVSVRGHAKLVRQEGDQFVHLIMNAVLEGAIEMEGVGELGSVVAVAPEMIVNVGSSANEFRTEDLVKLALATGVYVLGGSVDGESTACG